MPRTDSFARRLPYWATRNIDTPNGPLSVVVLVDGTFLVGAHVAGIDVYAASNAEVNGSAQAMRAALNGLPENAYLQAIWRTGFDYNDVITDYARTENAKALDVIKEQRRRRVAMLKGDSGLIRGRMTYWLGFRKALGDIGEDPDTPIAKFLRAIFEPNRKGRNEVTAQHLSKAAELAADSAATFFGQLERAGLVCEVMSESHLLYELQCAINPISGERIAPPFVVDDPRAFSADELADKTLIYRPLTLREQLPFGDFTWTNDHYTLDDPPRLHRVLGIQRLPPVTDPMLCLATQFATRAPFTFSHTIMATNKEKLTERLIRRRNVMAAHASAKAVRDIAADQGAAEAEQVLSDMLTTDQRLFSTATYVSVTGADHESLDRATREVKRSFADLGAVLSSEVGRQHQAAFSLFPGGGQYAPRKTTLMTNNAADLLPIFDPSLGDDVPQFLYHTRKNGLRRIAMGPEKQNKNVLVFGSSGSGKSFNGAVLLEQLGLAQCSPVLIVDIQGPEVSNYKVLAEAFGGSYVPLAQSEGISFNPFFSHEDLLTRPENGPRKIDREKVSFLKKLICVMALPPSREEDYKAVAYEIARKAVLLAYEETRPKRRTPLLRDVVKVLQSMEAAEPEHESIQREMYVQLSTWTKDPARARLIDAPRKERSDGAFFQVFDFYGLERDRELATVLLLSVSFHIWAAIHRYPQELTKFVAFDECWKLLTHPVAAEIIQDLFRTGRKYNASSWAITQDLHDFLNSPLSAALLQNTPTIILNKHVSNHAAVTEAVALPPRHAAMFESLEFRAGAFSELLFVDKDTNNADVCRLKPTPFDLWLNTSKPEDVGFRNTLMKEQGMSLLEAIRHCADNFPGGAPNPKRTR